MSDKQELPEPEEFGEEQSVCPHCKSNNIDRDAEDLVDGGGNFRGKGWLAWCYECGYEWSEPSEEADDFDVYEPEP